jgi:hypothetical protein
VACGSANTVRIRFIKTLLAKKKVYQVI